MRLLKLLPEKGGAARLGAKGALPARRKEYFSGVEVKTPGMRGASVLSGCARKNQNRSIQYPWMDCQTLRMLDAEGGAGEKGARALRRRGATEVRYIRFAHGILPPGDLRFVWASGRSRSKIGSVHSPADGESGIVSRPPTKGPKKTDWTYGENSPEPGAWSGAKYGTEVSSIDSVPVQANRQLTDRLGSVGLDKIAR